MNKRSPEAQKLVLLAEEKTGKIEKPELVTIMMQMDGLRKNGRTSSF